MREIHEFYTLEDLYMLNPKMVVVWVQCEFSGFHLGDF